MSRFRGRVARVGVLGAVALATASCGARWSDEQATEVVARGRTAAIVATRSSTTPGGVETDASSGAGGSPVPATPATTTPDGRTVAGDSVPPAGSREDDTPVTPTDLPCEAPSTEVGITADTITIGTINSLSGPVPGLAASALGAARAQVASWNARGGVCGRQIVLREADDGTDNGRYRTVFNELRNEVFAIVGGFALGDIGALDLVESSGTPIVNSPSAQSLADLPSVIDIVPNADRSERYRYIHDNGGTKASLTYLAVDQSRFEADLQRRLMEAEGIQVVQVQELPISTLSYDSAARSAVNSGAEYLFFIGDANSNVQMARAVADTGHRFAFFELFTFAYGAPSFLSGAGSAAEGVVTWLRTLPNEDAGVNEEVARYNQWMERVAPGQPLDTFASDSWAASKAFFEGLGALPGPITRDAFLAQIRGVDRYDADGFYGPIHLGAEVAEGCTVGMQVRQGTWQRMTPAQGFLC